MRDVTLSAFPTSAEADLVDALRSDDAWIDGLSFVVTTTGGTVVGHALLTRCTIGDAKALCLAPCSVTRERQRQGAGSAVIRAALDRARSLGESWVVVLGHPDYYPRFGFQRASEFGITLTIDVPADALMVLSLDGSPVPSGTVGYAGPLGIP